jgi:hypothetical protein
MSLILTSSVLAALLFSSAHAFEPPAATGPKTSSEQGFRGRVKSARVEVASIDGAPRVLVERSIFDRNGRALEYAHAHPVDISSDRIGYQVFRYIYDSEGRISEEDTFDARSLQKEAKTTDLQRHTYKFDSRGRCIEEQTIGSDGESYGLTIYEYDSQGDPVRKVTYAAAGEVESIEDRMYGPGHRLLSEKTSENRSGQGSSRGYHWAGEHRYDAEGNQTDMFSYQQGVIEAHWVWAYDERGRLTSVQITVADPAKDLHAYGFCGDCGLSSGRTVYKYDHTGRITEERVFQPGDRLVGLSRYNYDSHGNRTREQVYNFGSSGVSRQQMTLKVDGLDYVATWTNGLPASTFSYDSHGNWIRKVSVNQADPADAKAQITSTTYRVIEYY